jgi:hypothetical protein
MDASGSGKGLVTVFCEHGNEHLGFIKGRELLTNHLLKTGSVP